MEDGDLALQPHRCWRPLSWHGHLLQNAHRSEEFGCRWVHWSGDAGPLPNEAPGAVCKGGIHFGSCYLQCNWHVAEHRTFNLDLLQNVAAVVATLKGPWIIGGDWQCPPEELRSTGWLKTVKGVIYAPKAPTCGDGDRIIDYFVVSEDLAQSWAIVAACVIGDATFGPPQTGPAYCAGGHQDDHGEAA